MARQTSVIWLVHVILGCFLCGEVVNRVFIHRKLCRAFQSVLGILLLYYFIMVPVVVGIAVTVSPWGPCTPVIESASGAVHPKSECLKPAPRVSQDLGRVSKVSDVASATLILRTVVVPPSAYHVPLAQPPGQPGAHLWVWYKHRGGRPAARAPSLCCCVAFRPGLFLHQSTR